MSNDRSNSPPNGAGRDRRGSVASAALTGMFQRSSSISTSPPSAPSAAVARDHRRRLSLATIGLGTGSGPASAPFGNFRRGSVSTSASDTIDENAVDDDDASRISPTSPFARRMSVGAQAMRSIRGSTSPGSAGMVTQSSRRPSGQPVATPSGARRMSTSHASTNHFTRTPSDSFSPARIDQAFNWSEQLRSRAESNVSGMRPSLGHSSSPPRSGSMSHDRIRSVDMPAPPQQAAAVVPRQPERPKPDHMQERILKGDFYMD